MPECCPLLGVRLEVGHVARAPSIDRIDPTRGYVPGNVWIISKRANAIKNDATLDELTAIADALRKVVRP